MGSARAGVEDAIALARPGADPADLYNAAMAPIRKAQLPDCERFHCGHGIGIAIYDPPVITATDPTASVFRLPRAEGGLEVGTVFNIEVGYYMQGEEGFLCEDNRMLAHDFHYRRSRSRRGALRSCHGYQFTGRGQSLLVRLSVWRASVSVGRRAAPRALGLRLLAFGYSARKVCEELLSTDSGRESRQIGIVEADGRTAAYTGAENLSWAGYVMGDGFAAMGNVLAGKEVVDAIAEEYQASGAYAFEDRLLRAVEAGRGAGGQEEGQCLASLRTFGRDEFSRCDLRVDLSDEPVAELRRVYDFYAPLVPYYVERPRNHKIGRYKDFLKRNGHARTFGPRPLVTRGPKALGRPPDH